MPRSRIQPVTMLALLVGLLLGSTVATGVALASGDERPRKTKAVKVCVTKKKTVRSASASGSCPHGTSKQKVNVQGPRGAAGPAGAAGPGAMSTVELVAPDEVVRPLGAGLTFRCRTASVHILVNADSGSDVRGLLGREAGGNNVASALPIGFAQVGGEDYVNGEVFGTDPATGKPEHVSFAISWLTSSDQCEVRRLRIRVS